VFSATFNNISVISWQSDLLVEETVVTGENHRDICVKCLLFVNNKIVKQHTVIIGVIYEHDQIISKGKNPPHCKNVVIY
jgi:hypothetical protein